MFCFCSFVKIQDCSCICINNLNNDFLFIVCSVVQPCLTLCNPLDYSQPGSSAHGIFQARTVERVAISYSMGSSQPWNQTYVSCIGRRFFGSGLAVDSLSLSHLGRPRNDSCGFISYMKSMFWLLIANPVPRWPELAGEFQFHLLAAIEHLLLSQQFGIMYIS